MELESGGQPHVSDAFRPRGIPARFTRVSIGLEDPQDSIADFKQAIARCG